MNPTQPKYTNRLAQEKSPYLLQHAHNPVEWYPWGKEAFEKARTEDKPVFLSIGYSTCHWCHVMEEESFENPHIAEVMNRLFVSIKVDREERPDIDKIYMSYVVAFSGSGGWPMSVFLTPEAKPFYGGTYFPPESRYGRPGIVQVLEYISDLWKKERPKILEASEEAIPYLAPRAEGGSGPAGPELLHKAFEQFRSGFDPAHGGFGRAPKFPSSHALSFLMKYHLRAREPESFAMVEKSLREMARGGICDQLGGGFHRYSVDGEWRVPHFEKMLYDQALLLKSYSEAFAITSDPFYERVARAIADYVLRDMRHPDGGFFSAEDADSPDPDRPGHKREGAFFVWKQAEIDAALGPDAPAFCSAYGVKPEGNALADPQAEFKGFNILYAAEDAGGEGASFEISRQKLFELREKRPRPHLDDKILTDWNGLLIAALAHASVVLREPRYRDAALRAAEFLLSKSRDAQGEWLHRWRAGEAGIAAQLDDHAFLAWGFLELYEATFDERWLVEAKALCDRMLAGFWDADLGGFYMTAADAEPLVTRPKDSHDGAIPSGNSIAALVLARLGAITGSPVYEAKSRETLRAFAESMGANPTAYAQMLIALQYSLGPSYEIVVADGGDGAAGSLADSALRAPLPSRVVLWRKAGAGAEALEAVAPFTREQKPAGGRSTVYVCRDRACRAPVSDLARLREVLHEAKTSEG